MSRATSTRQLAASARCRSCSWTADSPNAQGIAALHCDRRGHQVVAVTTTEVVYGDATAAAATPHQTAIPL